jgi:DNA replication protein DnaC
MSGEAMPTATISGTPQVLLAHHLQQLKFPTVLREYDKVARECARDGTDHPRYLLRLIELERIDRERRTIERRIRAARVPAVFAVSILETFRREDFWFIVAVRSEDETEIRTG